VAESGVDDFQAEVLFDNGNFFLRDLYPSLDKGLWHQLAPLKSDDSTAGNAIATNVNTNAWSVVASFVLPAVQW
jgi:hypothetical protein